MATSFKPSSDEATAHQFLAVELLTLQAWPVTRLLASEVVLIDCPPFCAIVHWLALSPDTRTVSPAAGLAGKMIRTLPGVLLATV